MKENNLKILLIDTSYPINSRNHRIIDSLKHEFGEENVRYATWNRNEIKINELDIQNFFFNKKATLGNKFQKLKELFAFRKFIKNSINVFNPNVIIASHWDSLILSNKYKKSGSLLIYENLDIPTGNIIIRKVIKTLEKRALKRVDAIVYASRFFQPLYEDFKGNQIILENYVSDNIANYKTNNQKDQSNYLTITYNGTVRYPETFINIFNAIGNLDFVKLKVYGYLVGKDGEKIYESAKKFSNIEFYGGYNYKEIPEIYYQTDLIWAVYPSDDYNVKYAISNKFHESIYFEVPGIFAANTKLGEMVNSLDIGIEVDAYNVEKIRDTIKDLSKNKLEYLLKFKENIKKYKVDKEVLWSRNVVKLINYIKDSIK
ncbi:MAG: hypothetical protein J1F67_12010 [Muribaculaceae bacterium]|nr:hypothetical protein [Muribaculaceae bacterium]